MSFVAFLPSAIAFIWAGVSLGGSLIAAPAKFNAPSLTRSTALEVGQAQFNWIRKTEIILCALLVIATSVSIKLSVSSWLWLAIPIAIFAMQILFIMPLLTKRTQMVIQGIEPSASHLHLIYVILEVIKFLSLIWAAFMCAICGFAVYTQL